MNRSRSPFRNFWMLDEEVDFLNHGAFGACPVAVLQQQQAWRDRLERQPLRFLVREIEPLIDAARDRLSELVGADPQDMVFVSNATTGVNTVLRSLVFSPGDAILITSHGYNACNNAARFVADRWNGQVQAADIPTVARDPEEITERILAEVTDQTRLAIVDHVTSPTALVFPIEAIVRRLHERGVQVLVDGAHAPGMLPLDLDRLGADYYTGNCHKWICAPKGAAFLHIDRQHHDHIRPLAISHGATSRRTDRSRLHLQFDWVGTVDPTPWICVRDAIDFLENLLPGGIPELMQRNAHLAIEARDLLAREIGVTPTAGDDALMGSLAAFVLPNSPGREPIAAPATKGPEIDPLQEQLLRDFAIEVPVYPAPSEPSGAGLGDSTRNRRMIRVACQAYNDLGQYAYLAEVLGRLL